MFVAVGMKRAKMVMVDYLGKNKKKNEARYVLSILDALAEELVFVAVGERRAQMVINLMKKPAGSASIKYDYDITRGF